MRLLLLLLLLIGRLRRKADTDNMSFILVKIVTVHPLGRRFGVALTRWSRCATLSPVNTGMGDCLQAGKLSHHVTSRPSQRLAFHPSGIGK